MTVLDDPRDAVTLPQLIVAAASAYGNDPAVRLEREQGAETLSFAQLDEQSATMARGLLARGIGKGSRIGFIFGNGPSFARAFAAIARIGAIAIPISTMIRANELVRVLRQSDVGGIIMEREFLSHDFVERFCEALPELRKAPSPDLRIAAVPYLRWIVSSGAGLPAAISDVASLYAAAGEVDAELLRAVETEVHPTDQAIEIYTSGSMALPKGVRHLHGAILGRAHYLARALELTRGKQVSAQLPMFWVGGLMMYLMPDLVAGATTVCTDRTLSNSRFSVGAVLAEDDLKLTAIKPYWGLGMTETLGPYAYGDVHRAPGRPLCAPLDNWADGYEHRIVDEDGNPVEEGGVGEIQLRGLAVTPGLHKLDRSTTFTPDGFLRTGDIGQVEGKRVHFTGRSGDMIKTDGSNVAPAEVEMELQGIDGVHNAYVIGVPDPERGELVAAVVVARDEDAVLDFGEIQAELRRRLSSYKVPRRYVQVRREDVPMLASNKVARRKLIDFFT